MASTGTLATALGFLPNWWRETTDATALDGLLMGWQQACGWKSCGLVLTHENQRWVKTVEAGQWVEATPPPELPDALRRLKNGEATVLYSIAQSSGRVFATVQPLGRSPGVVWADKRPGEPWTDAERAYMALTGQMIERSPALAALLGAIIDPDRLYQRLGDAAVICGRMAHDFDNLLQGVIGFADLTAPLVSPGSQAAGFVAEIGKIGQRGIQFTQQLHQLSRSGQVKPNPGSVPLAIAKEEARLKPMMAPGLRIEKDLPNTLPAVAMEATPLQTVLGHLLENAVEACPQGGVVRVSAKSVELTEADARSYLGRVGVGAHLQVVIMDSGVGIKPEVRRRLFVEPFFTTKVRHRGLGLAIAYRVLCSHRGGILLDSVPAPGTGTQVRVVIPLAVVRTPNITSTPVATAVGG
ncbi:MAG: HAMP domain-containing sensor histidine kinase [Gemmataceae bacterium]|nr:HAMP domain-containing histidine kinase [Gemmata sp.]MDW8196760.1 HAMP domain-containing sensor histidine kinase [Gemmataceae bacterium]